MPGDAKDVASFPREFHAGKLSFASRLRRLTVQAYAAQIATNNPLVLKIISLGTLGVMVLLTVLLLASIAAGNVYIVPRFLVALGFLIYAVIIVVLIRSYRFRPAIFMLLTVYTILGVVILLLWGLNVPAGLLVISAVIVLSGILLGARWIIPTTGTMIVLIIGIQLLNTLAIVRPDTRSLGDPSSFIDVGAYSTAFLFIAVVSWLSGRRMEQSLARALQAEADLQAEKDLLAVRLDERERSLREAQLEEMRQLYHFAELGQLGTVVLHDLANNLTVLTLDIDDIEKQHRSSAAVSRARESITYLDDMVAAARRQLRRNDTPIVFNAFEQIVETVANLRPKAARAGVGITVTNAFRRKTFTLIGDPLRFAQVVTILVTNAMEAYADAPDGPKEVAISLRQFRNALEIAVTDRGKGIDDGGRAVLFQPFHSTKPNGMGIGLFITREFVERHFKGSISLDGSRDRTRFVVRLPEYHGRRRG